MEDSFIPTTQPRIHRMLWTIQNHRTGLLLKPHFQTTFQALTMLTIPIITILTSKPNIRLQNTQITQFLRMVWKTFNNHSSNHYNAITSLPISIIHQWSTHSNGRRWFVAHCLLWRPHVAENKFAHQSMVQFISQNYKFIKSIKHLIPLDQKDERN